jgi:uncharacterized membrane protein YccC
MLRFDRAAILFSVNSFAAAMLGLFVGFSLGLPQPYWAMTTAYIVSQPLSGAVRSKALYRVMGTLLGGAAAVALVPSLVHAPILLSLALALWVGGCLTVSLLDRTPRSYLLMLAGYTAAIIGFPSVGQPEAVFDVAVARVTEIGLGILCATLVHSLVFPQPVGEALRRRLAAWLADADRWALDILRARDLAVAEDRRHLAAAASEIQILSAHLPFDTSRLRETTASVRALHERMLLLIPLLSGVSDRMAALAEVSDPEIRALLDAVADWVAAGAAAAPGVALVERIEALETERPADDWAGLLVESLLVRLADTVRALAEAHALMAHLADLDAPVEPPVQTAIANAGRRRMHSDLPLALLSGAAAVIAIMISCALWIGGGWGDGATAAIMAAVFCCFFAAMDDPVPAIVNFGVFLLVALPLAAVYMFAILPAIDSFPMLVATMAPPLLLLGAFVPDPRRAGSAMAVIMGFCNALALQGTFSADFASFLNINLGQFVGLFAAIFVTAGMRSMGADASVRRLLGQTWKGLARLARAQSAPAPAEFAARLVDRLGLLTPKLAAVEPGRGDATAVAALRDLRIGMNLVALQDLRPSLSGAPLAAVDAVLARVGDHFAALSAGRPASGREQMLDQIDAALAGLAGTRSRAVARGVTSLVGLRRNLFPDAPAYAPETVR